MILPENRSKVASLRRQIARFENLPGRYDRSFNRDLIDRLRVELAELEGQPEKSEGGKGEQPIDYRDSTKSRAHRYPIIKPRCHSKGIRYPWCVSCIYLQECRGASK